ncbi:hypothetical protein SAMN05216554_0051 [Herbiconiux ginsengi]|uniref:Centromere-binding protein ParB C-terminal domain-containing protein n=1 Tax=Herbiconiux ginsengi TaxID=381665 RepID=A0A1H3U202_9MICO|nr:hypothetical protein SAMN05216554_0051 [Herbiconiux ginsengi]
MSQPQRRRPGSASPIKLVPTVEPVQTPTVTAPEAPVEASAVAPQPSKPAGRKPLKSPPATAPTATKDAADVKTPVTVTIHRSVKKTAETAVLRTAGFPNGYPSFSALVEGAIQRELQRLADEYNGGEAFTPNGGSFRQGRPFSS